MISSYDDISPNHLNFRYPKAIYRPSEPRMPAVLHLVIQTPNVFIRTRILTFYLLIRQCYVMKKILKIKLINPT